MSNKHKRTETQDWSLNKLDQLSKMGTMKTLNEDLPITRKNKIIVLNKKLSKKVSKLLKESDKVPPKKISRRSPS